MSQSTNVMDKIEKGDSSTHSHTDSLAQLPWPATSRAALATPKHITAELPGTTEAVRGSEDEVGVDESSPTDGAPHIDQNHPRHRLGAGMSSNYSS